MTEMTGNASLMSARAILLVLSCLLCTDCASTEGGAVSWLSMSVVGGVRGVILCEIGFGDGILELGSVAYGVGAALGIKTVGCRSSKVKRVSAS